jgi:hypothetical protein
MITRMAKMVPGAGEALGRFNPPGLSVAARVYVLGASGLTAMLTG